MYKQPAMPDTQNATFNGTMERSCGPADGLAYTIVLKNGITAWIYEEAIAKTYTISLTPNADGTVGNGALMVCSETDSTSCVDKSGSITITSIDKIEASGNITIDGTATPFHVQRIDSNVLCG
jgi:hypothetical protein